MFMFKIPSTASKVANRTKDLESERRPSKVIGSSSKFKQILQEMSYLREHNHRLHGLDQHIHGRESVHPT